MGINTIIHSIGTFPVPSEWIFEKLLNLTERLAGQSVTVKSVFNAADTNPSMIIFYHNSGRYKFKDFSSGKSGDSIDFVQEVFNLADRQDAFTYALRLWKEGDFETYITTDLVKTEYRVSNFKVREWNTNDVKFWTQFGAGSVELGFFNIKPLEFYTFEMTRGSEVTSRDFSKPFCYGYFRADGTLYKIYNPKDKRTKFIKVVNYIQGHDQLTFKTNHLIIQSSLKDILSFNSMKFKEFECIAPDSENVMLTKKQLNFYLKKYKHISVLFDNDGAGKRSAEKYRVEYGLPIIPFDVEKDVAECVSMHGPKNSRIFMEPFINEILLKSADDQQRTQRM